MKFFRERPRIELAAENEKIPVLRTPLGPVHDLVVSEDKVRPGMKNPHELFLTVEARDTKRVVTDLGELPCLVDKSFSKRIQFKGWFEFFAHPEASLVFIPVSRLKDPREVFAVLHELGHVVAGNKALHGFPERYHAALEALARTRNKTGSITDEKLVLQKERNAWALAIHTARALKQKRGIDLFKLFNGREDFLAWLRIHGLRDYETSVEERDGDAITRDREVEEWKKNHPEEWQNLLREFPLLREREEFLAVKHGGKKIQELLGKDRGLFADFGARKTNQ